VTKKPLTHDQCISGKHAVMDKGPGDDMVQITSLTYNISREQFLWICLSETKLEKNPFCNLPNWKGS